MKTRSQKLAESAFQHIHLVEAKGEEFKKGYGRECLRFPSLVQACGLLQTLTFLLAKNQPYQREFATNLIATIASNETTVETFIATLRGHDSHIRYLAYTRSALQAALWYKRYAEAVLKVDPTENTGAGER